MAITADTVFDRVVVFCNCDGMNTDTIYPYNGTSAAVGGETIHITNPTADMIAQREIMQAKIDSGDAAIWYKDSSTWIEYDDLQDEHGLIHFMHPMHPPRQQGAGHRVLPNIVKNTDYAEDSRHRAPRHLHREVRHRPRRSASRTATPSATRSTAGTPASLPVRRFPSNSTSPPTTT